MSQQASVIDSRPIPRMIRQYSQEERLNAVALYDVVGSLDKTSETLGIPVSTLSGWLNNPDFASNLRTQKANDLAIKFDNAAHRFLELANKKAAKAPFNHLMTAAAIAVDKSRLIQGQPTSITESVERNELTVILQTCLTGALSLPEVIDVEPEE